MSRNTDKVQPTSFIQTKKLLSGFDQYCAIYLKFEWDWSFPEYITGSVNESGNVSIHNYRSLLLFNFVL